MVSAFHSSTIRPLLEMFIEWWLFIKTKNFIHNYSVVSFKQILRRFYLDTVKGTFDCFFFPVSSEKVTSFILFIYLFSSPFLP